MYVLLGVLGVLLNFPFSFFSVTNGGTLGVGIMTASVVKDATISGGSYASASSLTLTCTCSYSNHPPPFS